MAKPISTETRADIIKRLQAGESKENISKWFFVCNRTVTRLRNKFLEVVSYEPELLNCGRKPLVSDETMDAIVVKIQEEPDITLLELIDEFDLPISESALCRRLIKIEMRYKKRHSIQTAGNAWTLSKRARSGNQTKKKQM